MAEAKSFDAVKAAEDFKKSIVAKHGQANRQENLLGQKEEGEQDRALSCQTRTVS
eukprot:SAG11_NODE_3652_length_2310_cov_1.113071_2_plen_55_part_00